MAAGKIRVLVVDDSAIVRSIVRSVLTQHPAIEVIGVAVNGVEALKQIRVLRPDVVTLDVEMPQMNGLQVLERIGGKLPVAFVMCSALTRSGARITFEALRKGAFDYVGKPEAGLAGNQEFRTQLQQKVLAAARNKGRARGILRQAAGAVSAAPKLPPNRVRGWVVGIGISCGGPQTLHELLPAFPSDFVPILVTQHMPPQFTPSFAQHLDAVCAMKVREAQDGERLMNGTILIAPGSHHLRLARNGIELAVRLDGGPKVSGHRPSADVMLTSMAQSCAARCVGVIMTGMGSDGAQGIRELHSVGARTLAQDAETSLVYGMPKAAAETGCVEFQAPLAEIPAMIGRLIEGRERSTVPAR